MATTCRRRPRPARKCLAADRHALSKYALGAAVFLVPADARAFASEALALAPGEGNPDSLYFRARNARASRETPPPPKAGRLAAMKVVQECGERLLQAAERKGRNGLRFVSHASTGVPIAGAGRSSRRAEPLGKIIKRKQKNRKY